MLVYVLFLSISGYWYAAEKNQFKAIDIEDPTEVKVFFEGLQDDIRKNNIKGISKKIVYPLTATIDGEDIIVKNYTDLVNNYHMIFNDTVKSAIRCQKYEALGAQWRGIMIGRGTLWISYRFLLDSKLYNDKKHGDFSNQKFWKMSITKINYGEVAREYVKNCKKNRKVK